MSSLSAQRGSSPRVLFVEQLAELIGKTPATIRTFAAKERYKHLIPAPFKMPHSRRLCWYEHEVFAWMEQNRRGQQ